MTGSLAEGNDRIYGGSKSSPTTFDGNDYLDGGAGSDNIYAGSGNDKVFGGTGNDTLDGWTGNDELYGGSGNNLLRGGEGHDYLLGGENGDRLYGGSGDDHLRGEAGHDNIYAGTGVDTISGGTGMDWFFFETTDTGDAGANQADTIHDFNDLEDVIYLKGNYTYADNTNAPGDGQYSVWNNGNSWVVTWNAVGDVGYHDLLVKGSSPFGDIAFY